MQIKLCDACGIGSTPIMTGGKGPNEAFEGACDSCGGVSDVRLYSLHQLLAELVQLREAARKTAP